MILLVTNKHDFTADRVVGELDRRGVPFTRLNTEDFPTGIRCRYRSGADGQQAGLHLGHDRTVSPEQVSAVWYRRPEPPVIDPRVTDAVARRFARRESTAALRGFLALVTDALWVNHPDANRAAEHKPVQLGVAARQGFRTPETLVTNDPQEAAEFQARFAGRTVAKSVGPAFIHPVSRAQVFTSGIRAEQLAFLDDVRHAPVILQERIDKKLEIRVTVAGDRVLAAEIDSQASDVTSGDWRRDVFEVPHRVHELPEEVAERCLQLVRRFGLVFGALDLILTPDGEYVFLELNPNGEWDWIEGLTDLPIAEAIASVLVGPTPEAPAPYRPARTRPPPQP